jgi:hypothetical protein
VSPGQRAKRTTGKQGLRYTRQRHYLVLSRLDQNWIEIERVIDQDRTQLHCVTSIFCICIFHSHQVPPVAVIWARQQLVVARPEAATRAEDHTEYSRIQICIHTKYTCYTGRTRNKLLEQSAQERTFHEDVSMAATRARASWVLPCAFAQSLRNAAGPAQTRALPAEPVSAIAGTRTYRSGPARASLGAALARRPHDGAEQNTNTNTKYTCDTGQTRNKLLAQWVHLTNHAAGHSSPGTAHLTA